MNRKLRNNYLTWYVGINGYLLLLSSLVVSDSLQYHGLQHARLSYPSPSPRACLFISTESVMPSKPSHPLLSPSTPAFLLSQHQGLFQWVSSSHWMARIGASASVSVLPVNIQDWFPLGWIGLISLQSRGLSRVFSNTTVQQHQFFGLQPSLWPSSHIHTWLLEKP